VWGSGGGGIGIGGWFLATLAASFIGTAAAQAFFDNDPGTGSDTGDSGDSGSANEGDSGSEFGEGDVASGDMGGDFGGGDFGGGDFGGGDFGGI
jgi:hypothetical protein